MPDGSLWKPTKWTVICGRHFVHGKPSNLRDSPDFVPSKCLGHTPATGSKSDKDCDRFDRVQNRNEAKENGVEQVRCFKF